MDRSCTTGKYPNWPSHTQRIFPVKKIKARLAEMPGCCTVPPTANNNERKKKNQSYYTCVIIVERSALGDFTWRGALEFYALILAMAFFMRHEFNFFPQQFFLFQSWSFVWLVPKYIEGLVHVYTWPVRLPPAPTFDNSCTCPIWTYWFKNISWTTVWF